MCVCPLPGCLGVHACAGMCLSAHKMLLSNQFNAHVQTYTSLSGGVSKQLFMMSLLQCPYG